MIINKKAQNKKLKNNILALSAEASKAKNNDVSVINATSGMYKDEDGRLYEFLVVKKVIDQLSKEQKFGYSNTAGNSNFTKAILLSVFGSYAQDVINDSYYDVIPTPGGSGALNLAFSNYVDEGETILLPNYMWENYLNFAKDMSFKAETYSLFNKQSRFDYEDLLKKVNQLKERQNRILILINDPCQNPTGFCMEDEDYDHLLKLAIDNPKHNFVYLIDVAYFDFYNVDPNIIRRRYAKMKDLPNNAIVLFAFSGSKSFGLYGLRIGALLALSKDKEEITAFKDASTFSSRAKWSNTANLGINIVEKIVLDETNYQSYLQEMQKVCFNLNARGRAFIEEANKIGLPYLPYTSGFFICVPCQNPDELMKELHEDKVYLVAGQNCLRIALSSITTLEAKRLPLIIKNRLL